MNRVVVTVEQRFEGTPDGRVWTPGSFAYSFWERYLEVFDQVQVLGRVRAVTEPAAGAVEATGRGVLFARLPHYRGAAQLLIHSAAIRAAARRAIGLHDAVILRVPSPVASLIERGLVRRGIPYALEVVGDPYDVFSPGAVRHPLRRLIRWKMTRDLRRQARGAIGAAYVTRQALQKRYPCRREADLSAVSWSNDLVTPARPYVTHYSSVDLDRESFLAVRSRVAPASPMRLVTVGSFEQLYKGPDVLVEAMAICVARALDVTLLFVGGGRYMEEIRRRAAEMGIGARVQFAGHVTSRVDVLAHLDAADLFVLPSRQEGLPRAMIEAMARGLPCVGTTVGGIPELLNDDDLVPPGDAQALARKIEEVVRNPSRLEAMSRRSIERARDFTPERLAARRAEFYRHVLEASRVTRADAQATSHVSRAAT
jgi:glycosyltransferase involved in cell wall biosynthesis